MLSEQLLMWKAQRIRNAYRRGYLARFMGKLPHENPYGSLEEQEGDAWARGWQAGCQSVYQLKHAGAA